METLKHIEQKILKPQELTSVVLDWKKNKNLVVFTNGCFDIIHYGHVNYLAKAKDLGHKLVIGLNSDSSVKRLKGDSRPINNEYARSMVLASLEFIDAIIIFDEDTPERLIKMIFPDILVKGGDYSFENIVGADFVMANGGLVEIIPFVDGYSTTNFINKFVNSK
ncbi:MAG: D-glycero-beta-D-manno-heptose 1-phosphate adenylyltransferase [Bacteroidales bacterium]|jgi:rfaE bifunctional protein nucleotidyltransferase chain/domain|nr:D-glycero-beta-D-manno-heptose 1-phosphate adenylyltransferase [Bacteroidales bacterium]